MTLNQNNEKQVVAKNATTCLPDNIRDDDSFMSLEQREEWEQIDNLVAIYQKSFDSNATKKEKEEADKAAQTLIESFAPFFYKYLMLITTGDINWDDYEQRLFISMFMETPYHRSLLYSKKRIDKDAKNAISQRFNFIKETYGNYEEDYILTDLHMLFMILCKRYQKGDRSFCCYLYNVYRYEVFRHIQKLLRNPLNIHYRSVSYDEEFPTLVMIAYECDMEERLTTTEQGLPSISWIFGQNCSDEFKTLTPLERKIISKYYIEKKTDKQISRELGIHINTCNNRRHRALKKVAEASGLKSSDIKRCRNSGIIKN